LIINNLATDFLIIAIDSCGIVEFEPNY